EIISKGIVCTIRGYLQQEEVANRLRLPGTGFTRKMREFNRMSTVLLTRTDVPTAAGATDADFSRPISRPKPGFLSLLGDVLNHGGPGYLQFAITNVCNAKCDFCGFAVDRFDPRKRRSVTLQEARDVIDIAVRNHIGYLLFVGGEPLVHRDLRGMTRYAAERG